MARSLNKNKQSGFTLIELMVVMAIIAILATAGLSAYTGYIKKARDAVRIADINAINKIVIANMSVTGAPPQTALALYNAVKDANNGTLLMDPLSSNEWNTKQSLCIDSTASATLRQCSYTYRICDGGMGYAVGTRFESASNLKLYLEDTVAQATHSAWGTGTIYEIGSCQVACIQGVGSNPPGCPATNLYNQIPTTISLGSAYLVGYP